MSRIANMREPYQKAEKRTKKKRLPKAEWLHMGEVKRQPCIITGLTRLVEVHHCFHDRATRFHGRRAHSFETIPLDEAYHKGMILAGGLAIHKAKKEWREVYGADHSYIPAVLNAIYGDPLITFEEIEEYWRGAPEWHYERGYLDA
jgi:hypothetical protein